MIWRILRNGQLKTELYINTKKTKALLVMEKRLQHKLRVETASLQLHLNATNINQILHHKLLGLIIDKDLRFQAHIDEYVQETVKTPKTILISRKAAN